MIRGEFDCGVNHKTSLMLIIRNCLIGGFYQDAAYFFCHICAFIKLFANVFYNFRAIQFKRHDFPSASRCKGKRTSAGYYLNRR
ncbi:MAG: hypothetical protein JWR54_223 [Mucilaginibacter sp.]|nr:hypothetical protein [Mucilaginibacter sp.]